MGQPGTAVIVELAVVVIHGDELGSSWTFAIRMQPSTLSPDVAETVFRQSTIGLDSS